MARIIKNFRDIEVGTVFTRDYWDKRTNNIQYIKIKRPNGKYGAMAYSDFEKIKGGDIAPLMNGTYPLFTDCCSWGCVTYDTELERTTATETKNDKPYLLINKADAEAFRMSEENAKLFEYLSEYVDFDDFEVIRTKNIKEL